MSTADDIFIAIFSLWAIQSLAQGLGWLFEQWRAFQDLKDSLEADEEVEATK